MDRVIRIFLADASRDFTALLRAALEQQADFLVIDSAARGDDAYVQLAAQSPDVLVTDLLLPGLDGLSLLRRLKDEDRLPRTVVVSGFVNDRVARAASLLGVEDYLPKPCDMQELVRRLREVAGADGQRAVREQAPAIRQALMNFGVMPNLHGYQYLQEGIRRALADRSVLRGITKILYPDLARQFGTTPPCVERSIRGAVVKAWEKGTPEQRRRFFEGVFDGFSSAPSNSKFINAMVEFIEISCEKPEADLP